MNNYFYGLTFNAFRQSSNSFFIIDVKKKNPVNSLSYSKVLLRKKRKMRRNITKEKKKRGTKMMCINCEGQKQSFEI